ncbi:MAG: LD-carboxypeptidase [Bacteroidetes bacterium]|nr:LD-carboxypeptidase [Bacteroidota bacterium]NCQ11172.1 LD-carboxypeptidase [Bacteroidota bacterium]
MIFSQAIPTIPLRPVPRNGCIALTSPASSPDPKKLHRGIAYLEQRGYSVRVGQTCYSKTDYLAGDDALRANEFLDFIEDDSIDAVFCTRGGFGSMKILRMLDFDLIKEKRKLLVGFSDITSLLLAIYAKTGVPGISGMMPVYHFSADFIPKNEEQQFWSLVETGEFEYEFSQPLTKLNDVEEFIFSGPILAGTLSLLTKLLGTPYEPNFNGHILLIEDIGERTHKLESYFEHLSLSGALNDSVALLLGEFTPAESEEYSEVPSHEQLINRVFKNYRKPFYSNLNYGHIPNLLSVGIGLPLEFSILEKASVRTLNNLFE